LRHSKPHVTRERYIKVFDHTVLEAVEKVQARIEELRQAKEDQPQLELRFGDDGLDLPVTVIAESPRGSGFAPFSPVRPPEYRRFCGKLLKPNRGEVAEWLNAAVC
jgi:hypothetical protein